MHEAGIALEIYKTARTAIRQFPEARLETVKVAVGELSAVEPDLLRFAWQAIVSEGPDCTAKLDILWKPARQYCRRCRRFVKRCHGSWVRLCLRCGGPVEVQGGDELDLLQIAYQTDSGLE